MIDVLIAVGLAGLLLLSVYGFGAVIVSVLVWRSAEDERGHIWKQ